MKPFGEFAAWCGHDAGFFATRGTQMSDSDWSGVSMQQELLRCEIVSEDRVTDAGAGQLYYLKLGPKLIPLGVSKHFADCFQFALQRNARCFDTPPPSSPQETEVQS